MLAKIIKWARRFCVSLFTDWKWRDKHISVSWLGSPSGGAYADVGRLNKDSIVYSFGIATEISFDRAIIQQTGAQVYGFDPDPRVKVWLNEPERIVPDRFYFTEAALAATTGTMTFHITDMERMQGSLVYDYQDSSAISIRALTLDDLMKENGHSVVDYLKMDIEGAEYGVLEDWLARYETAPVRQLWIEFHPDGKRWTEKTSMQLVKQLSKIGLTPAYRNYFRCPKNILLQNTRI